MKVTPIAPNQTEVELSDGTCVLFSYKTPVAALVPDRGWVRTSTKYSSTTTKHVNHWLLENVGRTDCVPSVEQSYIDQLVSF